MKKKKWINIQFYLILLVLGILVGSLVIAAVVVSIGDKFFKWLGVFSTNIWVTIVTLLISAPLIAMTIKIILKPIPILKNAMEKVSKGEFDIKLETESKIDEIRKAYESFNIMVKELQSTEILQTDFISNVSHEFKTPINAIEGYAMLLQGEEISDEQCEYIDKILQNTKRLTELIGGILLLSKIENQVIAPKKEIFRLDEQIRKVIVALEMKWTKKEIEFDISMDEILYDGNQSLLYHVWLNLIDNAIKFSKQGGNIKITLEKKDNNVEFVIEDNGEGISDEDMKHIFDKFFQADSSHNKEGNGLGLTLVKRILNINEGKIECKQGQSGGCIFIVNLPL